MRRPRFTVRWLMALVALVAVVISVGIFGERTRRRWLDYRSNATFHEAVGGLAEDMLSTFDKLRMVKPQPEEYARYRARADYHRRMRIKYERAARRPWLPVEPDPPEPE